MEFFIPSLAVLLLISLVVFLVLPRFGAPVLAVLSLVLLFYGVQNHMSMFASEYRYSTWADQFKAYGPFVMIAILLLGVLGYMGFLFGTGSTNSLPANNLSAINAVMNATNTNTTPGLVNTLKNTATNVTNAITDVLNIKNNSGIRNNRGLVENLGNILASPFGKNISL